MAQANLSYYPADRWVRTRYAFHAVMFRQWWNAAPQFRWLNGKPVPGWFESAADYERAEQQANRETGGK